MKYFYLVSVRAIYFTDKFSQKNVRIKYFNVFSEAIGNRKVLVLVIKDIAECKRRNFTCRPRG